MKGPIMKKIKTTVKNNIGVPFTVILNKSGKTKYVSFFDARYKKGFTEYGQNVATYQMNTLLGKDGITKTSIKDHGLNLYGGVDDWYIDHKTSLKVYNWIIKNKNKLN